MLLTKLANQVVLKLGIHSVLFSDSVPIAAVIYGAPVETEAPLPPKAKNVIRTFFKSENVKKDSQKLPQMFLNNLECLTHKRSKVVYTKDEDLFCRV